LPSPFFCTEISPLFARPSGEGAHRIDALRTGCVGGERNFTMSQKITIQNAGRFALAGDAILTMVRPQRWIDGDLDDEKRFTYRIQRAKAESAENADPNRPWFVKVLAGPNNLRDYSYLGTIFPNRQGDGVTYRHGKKSRVSEDAPSAKGIAWFVRHLSSLIELRKELEQADMFGKAFVQEKIDKVEATLNRLSFYHEGRCGKCAKVLTVPESIMVGLGPVCLSREGGGPGILDLLARI